MGFYMEDSLKLAVTESKFSINYIWLLNCAEKNFHISCNQNSASNSKIRLVKFEQILH